MSGDIGQHLQQGRYQIQALLGQGGQGTVYLATDRNLSRRKVAIKENADTSQEAQAQFEREAVVLSRLTHASLPRVTDHFVEPSGRQYLVMDYVPGSDLSQIVREQEGPLDESAALTWIDHVMDALEHMHAWYDAETEQYTPIVHRDVKPPNIKLTPNGRVVLVDFGLAKYHMGDDTIAGARAFTPGYSPLEQYTGGTDVRSDIYALGATLYALLTAKRPPEAPTIATGTPLPLPTSLNPHISPNTEQVIVRAMQMLPDDRYQSVQEMRAALLGRSQESLPVPEVPSTVSQTPTAAGQGRRRTLGMALGMLILLAGLAGILGVLWGGPFGRSTATSDATPDVSPVSEASQSESEALSALPTASASSPTQQPTGTAANDNGDTGATPELIPVVAAAVSVSTTDNGAAAGISADVTNPAAVPTLAAAPTATVFDTPTATSTSTPAQTATPADTPVPTSSATSMPTSTPASTATSLPSASPSAAQSAILAAEASATLAATPVGAVVTLRATATAPAGPSPTSTQRATETSTPQPTATRTATVTETSTPRPTATGTSTATAAPTATNTSTPRPTATQTSTPTSAPTSTSTATNTPTSVAAPLPVAGATRINAVDGTINLFVPAGEFQMGAIEFEGDERPLRTVQLSAYWIAQTEVTNAQYMQCVSEGICTAPSTTRWQDFEYADHPVVDVDWSQAQTYAAWTGGRLPTEAEWEKAARGADGRLYPWGNQDPESELLNYRFQIGDTTPVGRYPEGASPFGLLDMAGNVEEWVADWYAADYYQEAPDEDPLGPTDGVWHVIRGGSYNSNPLDVRAAARDGSFPNAHFPSVGFRVAQDCELCALSADGQ